VVIKRGDRVLNSGKRVLDFSCDKEGTRKVEFERKRQKQSKKCECPFFVKFITASKKKG